MKNVLFVLLFLLMPFSLVKAYPNESAGYARLYWGESLNDVKSNYTTTFLNYNGQSSVTYWVNIPNANGELGFKGQVIAFCNFTNDRLVSISITPSKNSKNPEKDYQDKLSYLISICGPATHRGDGYAYWLGRSSVMDIRKENYGFDITLIETRAFIGTLQKVNKQQRSMHQQ